MMVAQVVDNWITVLKVPSSNPRHFSFLFSPKINKKNCVFLSSPSFFHLILVVSYYIHSFLLVCSVLCIQAQYELFFLFGRAL